MYVNGNHLGNVLTTISDRRIGVPDLNNPNIIAYYSSVILSSSDYYSFGSSMPNRGYAGTQGYRYGFNGKMDDRETGWQDYGMRMYNPSLARFFNVDPIAKQYPELTPYQFASNIPIQAIDLDGLENYPTTAPDSYVKAWDVILGWWDAPLESAEDKLLASTIEGLNGLAPGTINTNGQLVTQQFFNGRTASAFTYRSGPAKMNFKRPAFTPKSKITPVVVDQPVQTTTKKQTTANNNTAPSGSKVTVPETPPVKLKNYDNEQGFTAVYDDKEGLQYMPSNNDATPITLKDNSVIRDVVKRRGGHADVNKKFSPSNNDQKTRYGFAIVKEDESTIRLNWTSGVINENRYGNRVLPEQYRAKVREAVKKEFPGYTIKEEN